MMKADWERDDFSVLQSKISDMINEVPDLVKQALHDEVELIFNESQEYCPVDTNRLRLSGRWEIHDEPWGISASITYATDYAIYVHENLAAQHNPPTMAKFLEIPVWNRWPYLLSNINKRVERMLNK